MSKSYFAIKFITEAVAGSSCPVASQEAHINAANKSAAMQNFLYGPAMLSSPDNEEYYDAIAQAMGIKPEEVMNARCGSCAFNNADSEIQQCIAMGMGGQEAFDPMETIQKAAMGYCQSLHFITEGAKGCTQWVAVSQEEGQE